MNYDLIRPYREADLLDCLTVFDSNCPLYFDPSERELFNHWLHHQGSGTNYQSPTYKDALKDEFYVIQDPQLGIIGCGGYYIAREPKEARMAWGMIHATHHRQGYGTLLFNYRKDHMLRDWPGYQITLGTSQHTYPFYEKMGLKVILTIPSGYGPDLDRYDLVQ